MKKISLRVFAVTLLSVLLLNVADVYAGAAYTQGRAYLKEGCAFDAGKSYVGGGELHPTAPEASGKHVYREWNDTWGYDVYAGYDRKTGALITTTYHFWAQANPGYVFTGWYTKGANDVYTPVKDNTVDAVTYHYTDVHYVQSAKSGKAPIGNSSSYVDVDLYAEFIKMVQLSFVVPTNGAYSIKHKGVEVTPAYSSFTTEGVVKLKATPDPGYKFFGWYTTTDGGVTKDYFSFEDDVEPNFTNNATIGAEFVPEDGKATYWIQGTNIVTNDLSAANTAAAASESKLIVVMSDGAVPAGTYTISSGVTLLIPYSNAMEKMTIPRVQHYTSASSSPALSAYRKLTLLPGTVINVDGNICIGGQQTAVNGGNPTSQICGAAGVLDMSRGGTINLNSGSNLYAWGFVKGQDMDQGNNTIGVGVINAASGATVWEDYQCGEWRGGTASSTIYSNKSSWRFFPFQSYTIQNVEVPVNYSYGSALKCHWAIFGNGMTYTVQFALAASSESLFKLASGGTLKKWYDPTTDHVCYELGGATSLDALNLRVMGESVSSADYNLPVPANMKIILSSGTNLTVSKPMTMHAGSVVEIKSGATIKLNSNVYLYDKDDWGTYCMYAYYYRTYKNLSSHFNRGTGQNKDILEDAQVIVDGTLDLTGAGRLYSTAGGSNVMGHGGGTLIYGTLPGNTTMTQCTNLCDPVNVNIRSVNMHNDDGTYTKGIASKTFYNVNGRWFVAGKQTPDASKHTHQFTYITSGDVYGTGGTNKTVYACYTKDMTGETLCDKWVNIEAEGCANWWKGIDDTYLYNWSLNSAWHQFVKTGTIPAAGEGELPTDVYAGSDGKIYNKQSCDVEEESAIDGNCLYTVDGVKKALINGAFVAIEKNTTDEAYHQVGAPTTYYVCFDGCVWHPATKVDTYEKAYIVDEQKYIWYDGGWLAVTQDAPFFYSYSETNVKIYYEYVENAWTLATPVAEVTGAGGTISYIRLSAAQDAVNASGENVAVRLLKDVTGTFSYTAAKICTFDLNGHTLSNSASGMLTMNNAEGTLVVIDQSAEGTGKVNLSYSNSATRYAVLVTKGYFILNSGTIHAENTHSTGGVGAIDIKSGQRFALNGGTIEAVSKGDSWGVYTESSTTSVVNINAGTLSATTSSTTAATDGIHSLGGLITINGGTINAGKNTSTAVKAINLANGNSTLVINGGTVNATAKNTNYGVYVTAGSTTTVTGGTISATTTENVACGISSYGTTTISGGTISATAGTSDAKGLYVANNTTTVNAGATVNATATSNAYGIYYAEGTPTATVNGGTFTVRTTSTTGAYGVYANKGTGTINNGTFTVTAKTTGAEGLHVETSNTPQLFVNGGKFMVKNSDGAAAGTINNTGATLANFAMAGGYYNIAPNGSTNLAAGKEVKNLNETIEADLIAAGYTKKIASGEFTVTWRNYDGTVLATTLVEAGNVPVWTGATPTYTAGDDNYVFQGWADRAEQREGTTLTAISGATDIYAAYINIQAELIVGGTTTPYEWAHSAMIAALDYQQATVRLLAYCGNNCRTVTYTPTVDNAITTLDLNGHTWECNTLGECDPSDAGKNYFFKVFKDDAKLIITDNSGTGAGKLAFNLANSGDIFTIYVDRGELVLQNGTIYANNTNAANGGPCTAVVVARATAKFTMLGGTVEATKPTGDSYVDGIAKPLETHGVMDIVGGRIYAHHDEGPAFGIYAPSATGTVNIGESVVMDLSANWSGWGLVGIGTFNINGGTYNIHANADVKGIYMGYGGSRGNASVTGNPNFSVSASAYDAKSVYATGASSEITIENGTFTTTATSGNTAYGAQAHNGATITIKDGSLTSVTSGTTAVDCIGVIASEGGTMNVEGGNFTISPSTTSATWDNNLAKCDHNAASRLNISGGTFISTAPDEWGGLAVRAQGGQTTITGNPVFSDQFGMSVAEGVSPEGTVTVTIDGATFNCREWVMYSPSTAADITIWDGKFYVGNRYVIPDGKNLKIRGGYYYANADAIPPYIVSPSVGQVCDTTIDGRNYIYRVTTKYNVTWSVAGPPTVQEYNRNEIPSYGSTPVYPGTDTYEFIGWDKEIVPVTEDVTYTAQFRKYEAEVLEGEATTGEKFEHLADAWAEAENLPVATIKLLSDVSMATMLQYHPDSVETATTTLDLNNHILAYTGSEYLFLYTNKTGCKLIITDTSVGQGGQLKAEVSRDNDVVIAAATHYGALELQGGTIFSHNTSSVGSVLTVGVYPCRESSFTMTGGHIVAQSCKNVRGVFTESGSPTVQISGGSILATTEEAGVYGNSAFGVWAYEGSNVMISGDATITAHANIESYGVIGTGSAEKPTEVTIHGGTIHAIVEQQAAFGLRVNEYATIRMEGGSAEAHSNAVDVSGMWNIEGAHCSGNGALHISGGEISSSNGAMPIGVCVHGGDTRITGGKITSQYAFYAVDYAAATQTAEVTINGGTFIGQTAVITVQGLIREGTYRNNANVVVNGGYFYSDGWDFVSLYNQEGATPSTLVLKGGKYATVYGADRTETVISAFKTVNTTVNTISETLDGKTYVRELTTPFTITWDGGSYNKVESVNNGVTPTNDELVGKTFIRNDSSFFFTHWSPTPVPVLADATYRAMGDYYEAKVTVGVTDSLFTEFNQAWEYAMTQATATVTLLSNIRRAEPITYCPAEANGRHTLDLNDFTISENINDQILVVSKTDAKLTITDNSAQKRGRLYKQKSSDANIYGVVVYTGEVIMAGGTVYCENTIDNEDWHPAIGLHNSMNENAKITVIGGTVESVAKKSAYGICSYGPVAVSGGTVQATVTKYTNARALSQQVGTATVTGGTFDAIATGTGTQLYTVMADAWVGEDGSTQESTVNISGGTFNVHTDKANADCAVANAAIQNVGGTIVGAHGTMNISGGSFNAISSSPTYQSITTVRCSSERVFDGATPHNMLGESKGVITITGGNFLLDTRDGSGNIVENMNNTDLVRNWGTMDISGGTFTIYQNSSTAVANFRNKVTISGDPVFNVYARLGSVQALRAAAWCDANYCDADASNNLAEFEVNGGTYKAVTAGENTYGLWADGVLSEGDKYAMNAKITVNDGSFMVIAPHGDNYWPIAVVCENDKVGEYGTAVSNIIVNGGKFMARSGTEAENTTFHATNVHTAGHVVLTGGYYELGDRLSDYKADTCDVVAITSPEIDPEYNNGYRYKIETHYEAKVTVGGNERKFARFNDAWAYAMTQNNATIALLDNVTRTETINYNPSVADGRHTLDLNNFTITDNTTNEILALNRVDAKLTITDNSLEQGGRLYKQKESAENLFGVSVYQGEVILAGGTVHCENTTDEAGWHPAIALYNVMTDDAKITVTGGRVESVAKITAYAICAYGPVAVSGGTIHANATKYSNARALSQQHNTATITGGTFEAIASNTATWASAVVADAYQDASNNQHGTVNISGGTFSCSSTNSESYCALSMSSGSMKGSMTISGGKFRSNDGVITHSASGDLTVTGGYFNEKATGTSFRDQVASRVSAPYAVLDLSVGDPLYAEGYRYKVAEAYTLTWTTDGDPLTGTYTSGYTEVGATIVAPNTPTKPGYTFAAWTPAVAATMPAANTTYTATWTPVALLIFTGATDNQWSKSSNWDPACVPTEAHDIYIQKPCSVDIEHAVAKSIVIDQSSSHTGKLTVGANKGLEVVGTISRTTTGEDNLPTRTEDLVLETSTTGNASLIFNNSNSNQATVNLYSKGFIDEESVKNYQYIGVPVNEASALYNFYGSWMYSWGIKKNGSWGWVSVKNGASVYPWTGYCITQQEPTYYAIEGTLVPTTTKDITVPADENMVVGNSWTAPIDINALTTDDLEGLLANIYFFNTGVDKAGSGSEAEARYAGGTYVTVPIHAAPYKDGDDHINSMQGFFVKNTGESEGTLHLDYEKHVRGTTRGSIIGDALHAPKHAQAEEPVVLKIKVSGENYDDKLLLLEREDFSTGFDNGWDGDKWDGNESSLYLYTKDSEGTENSVSAIPEMEGTIIGFRAGEDDGYTLHFDYLNSDEPLYLFDTQTRSYTRIETGATYWFLTNDKEKHARFIITRTEGQEIATGLTPNDQSEEVKAKKLLIEDKMFILVNGMLFDATGKIVK